MFWSDMPANWPSHVPSLLTRFPKLDEDDVLATDGDREQLAAHLADTFAYSRADARASLDTWIEGLEPVDAVMDEGRDNARISASGRDLSPGEDPSDDDAKFGDDDTSGPPIGRT